MDFFSIGSTGFESIRNQLHDTFCRVIPKWSIFFTSIQVGLIIKLVRIFRWNDLLTAYLGLIS